MPDTRVKNLIAITVSTNYDDILSVVIHQNQRFFQTWYIVTHPTDYETIDVVENAGYPNIQLLYFDFYKKAVFNKGGAIRMAQEYVREIHMWKPILLLDSDIFLPDDFYDVVSAIDVKPDTLYGVSKRYDYPSYYDFIEDTNMYDHPAARGFYGFFQLYKQSALKEYKDSNNCSTCDGNFTLLFKKKIGLPLTIKHLGCMMQNWDGRKSKDDFRMEL